MSWAAERDWPHGKPWVLAQLAALQRTSCERSRYSRFARDRLLSVLLAVLAVFFALSAHGDQAVAVRAGLHDGFGRLVLEWPAPVAVAGRQEGSRYRLRLERPLEVVLDAAVARLDHFLASARLDSDGRELTLDLKPGVAVRQHIFQGRIVVLDLAHGAPSEQVEVRAGLHDGFGRIVFDWPVPITFDALTTDRQVSIRFSRAGEIDATRPAARLAAWLANASASRSEGRSEVRLVLQPGVSVRVFQVDDRRVAVDLSAAPARPAEAGAAVEVQGAASARPSTASRRAPDPDPAAPAPDDTHSADLTIARGAGDHGALLDFAWTRPVPAAAFVRGAHLWVVFAAETSRPEDLALPWVLRDYIGGGERVEASGGTAIRFALRRPLSAEARREGRIWRVRLSADARAPRPLVPLRLASPARLRLAPGEAARLVALRDPETGERLTVWPLLQPNLGQPRQSFVELELLATAQGLAWRPRSDRLQARIMAEAVEFDAPGGLVLSEPAGSEPSPPTIPAGPPTSEPAAPAVATEPPGEAAAGAPAAAPAMPAAQAARRRPNRPARMA